MPQGQSACDKHFKCRGLTVWGLRPSHEQTEVSYCNQAFIRFDFVHEKSMNAMEIFQQLAVTEVWTDS